MHIKVGFVSPLNSTSQPDFGEIYNSLVKRSRPSLVSAPPVCIRGLSESSSLRSLLQTEGIGTIRSHQQGPEYEDDGLSSDEAEGQDGSASDDEDDAELKTATPDGEGVFVPGARSSSPELTPVTPTAPSVPPAQPGRFFLPSIPKILIRRSPQPPASVPTSIAASTPQSSSSRSSVATTTGGKKKRLPGSWSGQKSNSYEFDADNDIVGIVMLEIHGASDLPRWRNSEFFYLPTPYQH
jgi:phosphatidylserine decarboxylase